jgi:DNA-directed RNA polymerase specialized sigma24 family protein
MNLSTARTGSRSTRPRLCDRLSCDLKTMSDYRPTARFPTTHWSRVLRAGDPTDREGCDALEGLCHDYRYPLYAFARRQGLDREEPGDLVQGFLADLIERRDLTKADPARGRFRSFLRTACGHFLSHARDHDRAQKRGGGRTPVSIDLQDADGRYINEPAHDLTAERLFERRWAIVLLELVLARLESEASRAGKSQLFGHLRPTLEGDDLVESYRMIGESLKMSEGSVKVAAHRFRGRYRQILREKVARTVDDPADVDAEIADLLRALA